VAGLTLNLFELTYSNKEITPFSRELKVAAMVPVTFVRALIISRYPCIPLWKSGNSFLRIRGISFWISFCYNCCSLLKRERGGLSALLALLIKAIYFICYCIKDKVS
jgi:hypothetical protein